MKSVDIDDAKARWLQLIDEAAAGSDVVISREGTPLVRITRLGRSKRPIKFGILKGKLYAVSSEFVAPLSDRVSADFEGQ